MFFYSYQKVFVIGFLDILRSLVTKFLQVLHRFNVILFCFKDIKRSVVSWHRFSVLQSPEVLLDSFFSIFSLVNIASTLFIATSQLSSLVILSRLYSIQFSRNLSEWLRSLNRNLLPQKIFLIQIIFCKCKHREIICNIESEYNWDKMLR